MSTIGSCSVRRIVAAAKDAHESFDVEKCKARRRAQKAGKVVFADDGGDLSKWTTWPKAAPAPSRAAEKGPLSDAPLMFTANGADVQKTWINVNLKPSTKYRLSYFLRLEDLKTTETWSRFSCRLKYEGAPRVGRGAPRFIETTGWIYVVREYETPKDLKLDSCVVECSFLDAKGRALVDGLRLEEVP